jgi:hypothetical protein
VVGVGWRSEDIFEAFTLYAVNKDVILHVKHHCALCLGDLDTISSLFMRRVARRLVERVIRHQAIAK